MTPSITRTDANSINDIQAALIDCIETSFLQQLEQNYKIVQD